MTPETINARGAYSVVFSCWDLLKLKIDVQMIKCLSMYGKCGIHTTTGCIKITLPKRWVTQSTYVLVNSIAPVSFVNAGDLLCINIAATAAADVTNHFLLPFFC